MFQISSFCCQRDLTKHSTCQADDRKWLEQQPSAASVTLKSSSQIFVPPDASKRIEYVALFSVATCVLRQALDHREEDVACDEEPIPRGKFTRPRSHTGSSNAPVNGQDTSREARAGRRAGGSPAFGHFDVLGTLLGSGTSNTFNKLVRRSAPI